MSAFYVGQRVRVVFCPACPENLGREATVTGVHGQIAPEIYSVAVDGDLRPWSAHGSSLEPLTLPPEAIAWEEACFDRDGRWRAPVMP